MSAAKIQVVIPKNDSTVNFDGEITMSKFSVTRIINGKKTNFLLTSQELNEAHTYKEYLLQYNDVIDNIYEMEDDNELNGHAADDLTGNEELIANIMGVYERNMSKHNMGWFDAVLNAIKTGIKEAEESGLLTCAVPQ